MLVRTDGLADALKECSQEVTGVQALFRMGQRQSNINFHLETSDGRRRTATLVIPSALPPPVVGRALVVMLHGAGGSTANVLASTHWERLAERENFVVVCPNGTPCDESKSESFFRNPQTWNDGKGFSMSSGDRSAEAKGVDDVGFLAALILRVSTLTAIDPRQVFIAGHSNGAVMASRFGASRPDLVAAVGVMAGPNFFAGSESFSSPVALISISGEKDPIVPLAGGLAGPRRQQFETRAQRQNAEGWARANGLPTGTTMMRDDKDVAVERWGPSDEGLEVRWIVVKNHGHAWAGGESRLPGFLIGPASDALDATVTMWEFFKAHPKPPTWSTTHQQALAIMTRAVTADEGGHYEAALELYQAGAELMLGAIKGAPEARKPEMRERATQCLDRAERIKQERELRRAAPRFGSPFPYADGCERC